MSGQSNKLRELLAALPGGAVRRLGHGYRPEPATRHPFIQGLLEEMTK
jgi:hypothetical protein